jgi:hypothetical protein
MTETSEKYSGWSIVEIMGHQTYAGFVTEQVVGGAALTRVDVPEVGEEKAFTKMFGSAAIYCITPVSEEVARLAALRTHNAPVSIYMPELHPQPERRQISAGYGHDEDVVRYVDEVE